MEWGGEYEDSSKAKAALAGTLPAFLLMMVLTVICLFNSLRVTLIIWLTVPLSIIGIVIGLLVFNQPFGFMALLGALSLSGMLIKNGIVLIDEINSQLAAGRPAWDAVVDASVSRVRPVSMAVLTTVFGLIPLLFDVFFGAMAVTIVVGLLFASALTLLVVPVLYVMFFKVRPERSQFQGIQKQVPHRAPRQCELIPKFAALSYPQSRARRPPPSDANTVLHGQRRSH